MAQGSANKLEEARKCAKDDSAKSEKLYKNILNEGPGTSDASVKNYELALTGLGALYRDHRKVNELVELIQGTRSVLSTFAKAKTAKLGKDFEWILLELTD